MSEGQILKDKMIADDMIGYFKSKGLDFNHRQALFIYYYCIHYVGSTAAELAGYETNNIYSSASVLLSNAKIVEAISLRKQLLAVEHSSTHELLTSYYKGAVALNVSDIVDIDVKSNTATFKDLEALKAAGIGRYIEQITIGKRGITVKVFPKTAAADALARNIGYFEADNSQKVQDGVKIYMPENARDEPKSNEGDSAEKQGQE